MHEQEEITIEVETRRLMGRTMAAATAPTPRTETEVQANVAQWKALGAEAVEKEPANYPYAACSTPEQLTTAGLEPSNATTIGSDICLISFDTVNNDYSGTRTFPIVQTFEADLPSLKNGNNMFKGQRNLKTFTGKIPNVTNATCMFSDCSGLTEWTVALPNSLTDANNMFSGCSGLTSWNGTLPNSITNATCMFSDCSGLTLWNGAFPNSLTDASYMFSGCSGLTEWTVALPNSLTDANNMFSGCSGLTEWTVALPNSITNASSMFSGCSGLTEWIVELPNSITNAGGMFRKCSKLESFTVSMPTGLKEKARNMFEGCKLNLASVKRISETIQNCTGTSAADKTFTLGIAKSLEGTAEVQGYLQDIRDKDWIVEVSYNA